MVTIPISVVKLMGWSKGTELIFIPTDDGIKVKKMDVIENV